MPPTSLLDERGREYEGGFALAVVAVVGAYQILMKIRNKIQWKNY